MPLMPLFVILRMLMLGNAQFLGNVWPIRLSLRLSHCRDGKPWRGPSITDKPAGMHTAVLSCMLTATAIQVSTYQCNCLINLSS